MSIKKTLFLALQKRLKANIATLNWVDKNMGQLNNLEQYHVFPMPAILIEFGRTEWEGLGEGLQQGVSIVRFQLIYENYYDSDSENESEEISKALAFFDFVEEVNAVLHGFEGDGWSPLIRIGEDEDNDHQNFVNTIVEYQTLLQDKSGQKVYKEVPVDVEAIPVVKKPLTKPASGIISSFNIP